MQVNPETLNPEKLVHTMRSFAIVPAAGHSRRMGRPKLLLPWKQTTVLGSVLQAWLEGPVDRVVVVARAEDSQLVGYCRGFDVDLIEAHPAPAEMKDSVSLALEHIRMRYAPHDGDLWWLAPADMPHLSASLVVEMLRHHQPADPRILVPLHGDRRGHPVAFPWPLARQVASLGPEQGVNVLLQEQSVRAVPCSTDGALADLDTPEDYRRMSGPDCHGRQGPKATGP